MVASKSDWSVANTRWLAKFSSKAEQNKRPSAVCARYALAEMWSYGHRERLTPKPTDRWCIRLSQGKCHRMNHAPHGHRPNASANTDWFHCLFLFFLWFRIAHRTNGLASFVFFVHFMRALTRLCIFCARIWLCVLTRDIKNKTSNGWIQTIHKDIRPQNVSTRKYAAHTAADYDEDIWSVRSCLSTCIDILHQGDSDSEVGTHELTSNQQMCTCGWREFGHWSGQKHGR